MTQRLTNRLRFIAAAALTAWLAACSSDRGTPLSDAQWQRYKAAFVTPDGRVIDTGNGGVSHSEGQGYGMLLAEAAGDRATFESLWQWTRDHLQREDALFGWRWVPGATPPVPDWNNATDGDLLIAWALALGGERWQRQDWLESSASIARRIRGSLLRPGDVGPMLMPAEQGFEHEGRLLLNPSYWVYPAFAALDRVDPDPAWNHLTASGRRLLGLARYGSAGVPPDWLVVHTDGRISLPEAPEKRRFAFEALRIPLYLCWASLQDPTLMAGYRRAWPDDQAPAWIDLANGDRAPYALPLPHRAMRQLVVACERNGEPPHAEIEPGEYYGSTLSLLSRVSLSTTGERP